jgi:hypothetical protein
VGHARRERDCLGLWIEKTEGARFWTPSPRHTHLTAVAQLATGQRPMLKSLELLSLSIASALEEQNDVHTAW